MLLDNIILTLFGCTVRTNGGRELQSSGCDFLLSAPNHTGNPQHTKSRDSASEVNVLNIQGKEPTVRSDS